MSTSVLPNRNSEEQAEFLASSVPASARKLVARAFTGSLSPRQAIKAKCLDCSGYQRAEVTHCTVILCPLHRYRPYQETHRKGSKNVRGSGISAKTGPRCSGIPPGSGSASR